MNKELWGKVKGFGDMYLEEELVVGAETILFVCTDDKDNRYLFMTYDSYVGIYIYSRVSDAVLIEMLEGRKPIELVYRESSMIYVTKWEGDEFVSEMHSAEQFRSDMLPEKDFYYSIKSGYIQDYIRLLKETRITDDDYCPFAQGKCRIGDIWDNSYAFESKVDVCDGDPPVSRQKECYSNSALDTIYNFAA